MGQELIETPLGDKIPLVPYAGLSDHRRSRKGPLKLKMQGPKKSRCDQLLRKF